VTRPDTDAENDGLAEVDAGEEGRRHLTERLSKGGVLPQAIAAREHSALACVRAIAPSDWVPALGFESGGATSYRAARRCLFELLAEVMGDLTDGAVVNRHGLALPTDPFLQDGRTPCFFCGEEVYRFIREPFEDVELAALWNESETPVRFSFAVLGWPPDLAHVRHGSRLEAADLELLAHAAVLVGVNVFDGDSYLIADINPSLLDPRSTSALT